jgi:Fur family transcriptional regulator, ferric uptake regulator
MIFIYNKPMNHSSSTPALLNPWLAKLQAGGYRITTPLKVIAGLLVTASRALGPVEIYDLGRQQYPRMGLVTVYRALEKLEELGLVQRVHQASGCHAYLRAANGHEHILLCMNCGRVEYFSGDDLTGLMEKVARQSGFRIHEHWLQLHGLCANCQ